MIHDEKTMTTFLKGLGDVDKDYVQMFRHLKRVKYGATEDSSILIYNDIIEYIRGLEFDDTAVLYVYLNHRSAKMALHTYSKSFYDYVNGILPSFKVCNFYED